MTFPWLAKYTTGLGDVDVCAAVAPEVTTTTTTTGAAHTPPSSATQRRMYSEHLTTTTTQPLVHTQLIDEHPDRTTIIPSNSSTYVSCFTQAVSSKDAEIDDISNVLVLKVSSFSPPGDNYTTAWTEFLNDAETCLETEYELIVVDMWM